MTLSKDFFKRLEERLDTLSDKPLLEEALDAIEDLYQEAWVAYVEAGEPSSGEDDGFIVWMEAMENATKTKDNDHDLRLPNRQGG